MAEYIDRAAAKDAVSEVYYDTPDVNLSAEKFEAAINAIPAADVAPVGHGLWAPVAKIDPISGYRCSKCRRRVGFDLTPYCPNCGAKMDGGDNDETD